MGAIRFLAIVILAYLAYRVIKNLQKPSPKEDDTETTEAMLKEDPICGKLIPQDQAVVYEHNGKKTYFCSKKCCTDFQNKQGEQK